MIDQNLKNSVLTQIKKQFSAMDRDAKLVILNTIGQSKESIKDMDSDLLVSKLLMLYGAYLDTLDMDNIVSDPDFYKISLFISGHNKKELKTLIKNY